MANSSNLIAEKSRQAIATNILPTFMKISDVANMLHLTVREVPIRNHQELAQSSLNRPLF
jgi:hypothetical protein